MSERAAQGDARLVGGFFADLIESGERPIYGYPKNHLPSPKVDHIDVVTGFLAARETR